MAAPTESQSARSVLMVRPAAFGSNPHTLASNAFQRDMPEASPRELQVVVKREFVGVLGGLMEAGVDVHVVADTAVPPKPDAVFPNNWVSFHADGTVVLYPMLAANRRMERREEVLEHVSRAFRIARTVDLSAHENQGVFLEGTGSLVLDREHRLAYACLSPRTHLDALGDFAQQLDFEIVSFEALDGRGTPIYHTNVLMCVGQRFAAICAQAIVEERRRAAVLRILEDTGHELILLSHAQMNAFAGNMLELESQRGAKVIAMSNTAWSSLDADQRRRIESHGSVVAADIPTIERCGGGSVRCMLAEIHLPPR
jgi:hypothetical protein